MLTQTLRVGGYSLVVKPENTTHSDEHSTPQPVGKRKFAALAIAMFGLSIAMPISGFTLAIIHSLVEGDRVFGVIGTICLIATIPIIILGSHLMDKFDLIK